MAGFERRNDAFGAAQSVESGKRLVVRDANVFGATNVLEVRVLRADAGVVEPSGDGVRLDDLAIGILQQVGAIAVQHAGTAGADRRRVAAGLETFAGRFDADETR